MKKSTFYYLWAGAFVLCALLSLLTNRNSVLQAVMTVFSLAFFAPPGVLLGIAFRDGDKKTVKCLRLISCLSLGLTLLLFILNILSLGWSEAAGNTLYYILLFLSVPARCCDSYALSLFLWACLLFSTFLKFKKE